MAVTLTLRELVEAEPPSRLQELGEEPSAREVRCYLLALMREVVAHEGEPWLRDRLLDLLYIERRRQVRLDWRGQIRPAIHRPDYPETLSLAEHLREAGYRPVDMSAEIRAWAEQGHTYAELAAAVGVGYSTVAAWALPRVNAGHNNVSPRYVEGVVRVLGIELAGSWP